MAVSAKKQSKALGYLIALAAFVFLFWLIDFGKLRATLSFLSFDVILYLVLLSVLLIYISSLKWQYFLEALGSRVPVLHLFGLYLLGYFINLLVPSYVGGDAMRSWYAGKHVGQHEAAAATILERYTGFIAMVTLALAFVWFVDTVTLEIRIVVVAMAGGLAALTALALSPKLLSLCSRLPKGQKVAVHLAKVQEGLMLAKSNRTLMIKALALSYFFHSITVLNTCAAAYAVGWFDPPVGDIFVVLPLILLIGAVPISPSGLGIQEGAFYFFLGGIGATPEQALMIGVILRVKAYVLAVAGGLVFVALRWERGDHPSVAGTAISN